MRILLLACLAFSSLTFGASQQQEVPQTRLELLKEQAVVLHSTWAIFAVMSGTISDAAGNAARAAAWDAAGNAVRDAAGRDAAWDAAWNAICYIVTAAWNPGEIASWNYNLYAGDRMWDKVTSAMRDALAPFGEESFPNVVFVFSDTAADDPRMAYFVPFVEKILEASERLLEFNEGLGSPEARRGEYGSVYYKDVASIIAGYSSETYVTPKIIF